MSDFIYPDVYTLTSASDNPQSSIESLRATLEERLLPTSRAEGLSSDLQARLDAELAWVERIGTSASWSALARLTNVAQEKRIPLGAPLGAADGTLIGAILCSIPITPLHTRPLEDTTASIPPGIEIPANRREELLLASAQSGNWTPWTPAEPAESGHATLWLRPSPALSILDAALRLAVEHPSPHFAPETADPSEWPSLSQEATAALKKAQVAGISHLTSAALKGWKGDPSPESISALIARSIAPLDSSKPNPPEGLPAWTEHTSDTGGALLYYDQFVQIAKSTAGVSPEGAAALRLAMLNNQTDLDGALHARFLVGCLSSGLDEQAAETLWHALAAAAPVLISRHVAYAWARVALRLANLKADHPAAFIAAALAASWDHAGRSALRPLLEDARRHSVSLLPPNAAQSHPEPALENTGKGWAIRWGLAFLPGWDRHLALRFTNARARLGHCASLRDLALLAIDAELSPDQLEALVRSGACDNLGGRDALIAALPSAIQWARQSHLTQSQGSLLAMPPADLAPEPPPGPRLRYARRTWEEQNLGVAFTNAHEIDELRSAITASRGLNGQQTSSVSIGLEQVGQSICLVGLLHDVRLLKFADSPKAADNNNRAEPANAQQMAVAWVEDLDGAIELVAFPPNYKRHHELWTENKMVIITARVRRHADSQGVYLLCEHLAAYNAQTVEEEINITVKPTRRNATSTIPLPKPDVTSANGGSRKPDLIPQPAQPQSVGIEIRNPQSAIRNPTEPPNYQLIITLPASLDDREDIDRMITLDKLLRAHQGPDTVTLRIPYSPETGAVTTAQLPRGVRYSLALEAEIRRLLGPDALALIKLLR